METLDHLVSTKEAARQLGVSVWTVYRWVDNGTLRGHRLSRKAVRVSQESIDSLIERTTIAGALPAPAAPKRRTVRTKRHAEAMARLAALGVAV